MITLMVTLALKNLIFHDFCRIRVPSIARDNENLIHGDVRDIKRRSRETLNLMRSRKAERS